MHTDDDLNDLVGAFLVGYEVKKGAGVNFFELITNKCYLTICTHMPNNNGYYGAINARLCVDNRNEKKYDMYEYSKHYEPYPNGWLKLGE